MVHATAAILRQFWLCSMLRMYADDLRVEISALAPRITGIRSHIFKANHPSQPVICSPFSQHDLVSLQSLGKRICIEG